MAAILPVVSILSLAATAVGTGVSYFGQQQAAKNSAAMAQYNYQLQTQQIAQQTAIMQAQSEAQAQQAEYQAAIAGQNSTILMQQASVVRDSYLATSEADKRAGEVAADRERDNARRFLSEQTNKAGASGFELAGTPLDSLASAAGILELRAQDQFQQGEIGARKATELGDVESYRLEGEARNQDISGSMSLYQAAADRWNGETAIGKQKLDMYGAEVNRMAGMNQAAGYKMASYGTLFSGFANLGSGLMKSYEYGGI